jgi:hypothetical protein
MPVLPDQVDGHRAAVGDVGGVHRLVADEPGAGGRVQAVGRDHQRRLVPGAVGERYPGTVLRGAVAGDVLAGAQVDAGLPAAVEDQAVQVAAVDDDVRRAVPPLHVLQVKAGQHGAVHRVLHDHAVREHAEPPGVVEQAVGAQDAGAVGRDLQARADLAELRGALEHAHAESLAGQRERGGQAADAAADHEHVGLYRAHRAGLPCVTGDRLRSG